MSYISSSVPCNVDAQLSQQRFGSRSASLRVFPFFAILASRLSSILFTFSFRVHLLILTHLMNFEFRGCCGRLR